MPVPDLIIDQVGTVFLNGCVITLNATPAGGDGPVQGSIRVSIQIQQAPGRML